MRYKSAKNMTYIPNEGVDMHGDADPGAFNRSHCNTMDIIITWRLLFRGSDPDYHHSRLYRQKTDRLNMFPSVFQACKGGQTEIQKTLVPSSRQREKVSLFLSLHYRLATHTGTLSPAFSRNKTAFSFQQLAPSTSVNSIYRMQRFGPCQ